MRNVKGLSLTLSSTLLASLLALSGTALAQESTGSSEIAPDSGVEAGVEGHNVPPQKPEESTESTDINNAEDGAMTEESELASDDGVDAIEERDSETGAKEGDQTSYQDEELVEDQGVDTVEDRNDEDTP